MVAKEVARRVFIGGALIWMIVLLIILGMNEIKWLFMYFLMLFIIVVLGLYVCVIFN